MATAVIASRTASFVPFLVEPRAGNLLALAVLADRVHGVGIHIHLVVVTGECKRKRPSVETGFHIHPQKQGARLDYVPKSNSLMQRATIRLLTPYSLASSRINRVRTPLARRAGTAH